MWQNLEISVSVVLINKAAADICHSHWLTVTQLLFSRKHRVSFVASSLYLSVLPNEML